jgi:hypothetical protein
MDEENIASKNRLKFLKFQAEHEWGVHVGLADKVLLLKEIFPCDSWSFFGKLDQNAHKYDFNSKQMELYRSKKIDSQTQDILRWVKMGGYVVSKKRSPSDKLVLNFCGVYEF